MFKIFREPYNRIDHVREEVLELCERLDIYHMHDNINGQLIVQTNDPNSIEWTAGVGRAKKNPIWEMTFVHMHPELKGSEIEKYIQWLDVSVYRTRIMLSRPKSSYSIHTDNTPRLHFPLVTNEQCRFVFTDPAQLIHMPADGRTYWTDTRNEHTFINGSEENRLHLVMAVKE